MIARRAAIGLALVLGAAPAGARDSIPTNWHNAVTDNDRNRLRKTRQAWTDALAKARAAGAGGKIAAEGALFDPDRAIGQARLPIGRYRCRVFKLGARAPRNLDFVSYPWSACQVGAEGEITHFTRLDGAQRPDGRLFDEGASRQVFLGTLVFGGEAHALDYGRDRLRDVAGIVERIGPARWRIVLPYPNFESLLDVIELVPER